MAMQDFLTKSRKKLVPLSILILAGAQLLDIMSLTGLMLSTGTVAAKYNVSLEVSSWILSAYLLTFGSFILAAGRFGDILGHRWIFMAGMGIIAVASIINATVENIYVLFVFRSIQGLGAALSVPTSSALVAHNYQGQIQAIAMALIGTMAAMGGIIGVIVGGAFEETSGGYRNIMWLVCGMSFFFGIGIFFSVEETSRQSISNILSLDIPGLFMSVVAVILAVFALNSAPGHWGTARVIVSLVLAIVIFIAFGLYEWFWVERWFPRLMPLMPRRLWMYKNYTAVVISTLFAVPPAYIALYHAALWNEIVKGSSPIGTAVRILPFGVCFAITCVVGGLTFGKVQPRIYMAAGPLLALIGASIWTLNSATDSFWSHFFPGEIFIATGTALFISTNFNVAVNSAPISDQGLVAGVLMTAYQVSVALSLAIFTSLTGNSVDVDSYKHSSYLMITYSALAAVVVVVFMKPDTYNNVGHQEGSKKPLSEDAENIVGDKADDEDQPHTPVGEKDEKDEKEPEVEFRTSPSH